MKVIDLLTLVQTMVDEGLGEVDIGTGWYDEATDEVVTDDVAILAVDGEKGEQIVLFVNGEVYDAMTGQIPDKDEDDDGVH